MKPKILLVEDEPLLISLYSDSLRGTPYRVLTATEELEALRVIRREQPNLILLDLMIPTSKQHSDIYNFHTPVGYEILRSVRAKPAQGRDRIRIVILSNLDSDEHRQRTQELGADEYWVKATLNPRDLPKRVDAVLGRP